jgi:hypothetical protein
VHLPESRLTAIQLLNQTGWYDSHEPPPDAVLRAVVGTAVALTAYAAYAPTAAVTIVVVLTAAALTVVGPHSAVRKPAASPGAEVTAAAT